MTATVVWHPAYDPEAVDVAYPDEVDLACDGDLHLRHAEMTPRAEFLVMVEP